AEYEEDRELTLVIYGELNNWNVSEVTDMKNLFKDMEDFNENISAWNVGRVESFAGMFKNATSFNKSKIKGWKPQQREWKLRNDTLKTAVKEFKEDKELAIVIYGELNNWNVTEVTDMKYLFKDMESFNEDISRWNVRNVDHFDGIFDNTPFRKYQKLVESWKTKYRGKRLKNEELRTVLTKYKEDRELTLVIYGELNNWNVSEVTDMKNLFKDMEDFNENI
ncbi:hypothetical protein TrVE_jg3932, partial [Triparma verrucosa]